MNYSSYHYWKNSGKKSFENKVEFLQQVIKEYANLKGYYGAPKITKNLCAKGIKCSVSKVSRAMKTL